MTPSPITIPMTATVREAIEVLRTLDVRHLPVLNEDGELFGILSDRDLFAASITPEAVDIVGPGRVRLDGPVTRVMSSDVLAVDTDADVRDVVDLLVENKIGAVPVVSPEGRLEGIVSYVDLLRLLGRLLDELPEDLQLIEEEEGGGRQLDA